MQYNLFLLVFLQLSAISFSELIQNDDVITYIKQSGYNGEAHQMVTEDGYILKIHRVFPKHTHNLRKFPVFLMHSAFSNSLYYLNTPNISLGFFFADEGYDVYLGNVRGSKYATAHKWLSTESLKYWQFSFHEMGVYDLPAMIDYSLEVAQNKKIYYIGHSQACTQLLTFLSLRPNYNEKVIQSHLM